jgi:DNA-directed RNA polymerase subunit F
MTENLKTFRDEFLNADTWAQRKDGIPLDLLDNLSEDELKKAEKELIDILSTKDDWPIKGLGYIKSKNALVKLYELLPKSNKGMKVTIAHSIFQICKDKEMISIALTETPKVSNQFELIDLVYLLSDFQNEQVTEMLNNYRGHKEYLVAYNATQAMGLSTKEIVEKFRKEEKTGFWNKLKSLVKN